MSGSAIRYSTQPTLRSCGKAISYRCEDVRLGGGCNIIPELMVVAKSWGIHDPDDCEVDAHYKGCDLNDGFMSEEWQGEETLREFLIGINIEKVSN